MPRTTKNTRATQYGIKANALARDAVAKLERMRAKLIKLQEPWAEADPMIETATDQATAAVDDLIKQYKDSAEYLNEPMDA